METQYEKYKETIKAYSARYRKENQEKIKEYRTKNKEKIAKYNAEYNVEYSKRRRLAFEIWKKDEKENKQLLNEQTKL
jgi:hypothetical protein